MRRALGLAALLVGVALAGCSGSSEANGSIVVTTNILGDVVGEIVGDEAEVVVLMPPNADPHMFGISPRQADAMQSASLVVYNGLGLEEGVLTHVEAAADEGVTTLEVAAAVLDSDETDAHFWTDPRHVADSVQLIADRVIETVPDVDAEVIRQRAARYAADVMQLHDAIGIDLAAVPLERRNLVTNHHVFGYFAEAYDLTVVGAITPGATTLASPSAADLADLATTIEQLEVPAIFVEASHPERLAQVLADEADVEVQIRTLYSESLGAPGSDADTYLRMMRFNAGQIVAGLTGDAP